MNNIGKNSSDIGYMDTLAAGDSALHRLDPRAKLVTTLIFIISVVSFDKYAFWALTPFLVYPVALIAAGGLPAGYLLKKVLLVSPFAIMIGIFNPLIDREILFHVGPIGISGGFASLFSILMRFTLTVTAALILVATTGFNAVCDCLIRFGVPRPFVVQLQFFHRYLFVLTDEAERMLRARLLRSFGSRGIGFGVYVSLVGHLLLRALDRSERVYRAMCCRGFDGHVRIMRTMKFGAKDVGFAAGWVSLFVILKHCDFPAKIGGMIMRLF